MISEGPTAAFHHLSDVVGCLLEDHAHLALTAVAREPDALATDLHRLGEDLAVLASAMQILVRRSDWTSRP